MTSKTLAAMVALFAIALLGTACDQSGDQTMTANTITQKQAEQQVQANIHTAAAQLPATAKLEQQLTDNGPQGRVTASSTYQVHGLEAAQYPSLFENMRNWWTQHSFRVLDDSHQTATIRYLWVENNNDGFRMAMQSNDAGGLFLISSSPCVWPNGTPPTS
jgi:hypothetical protein